MQAPAIDPNPQIPELRVDDGNQARAPDAHAGAHADARSGWHKVMRVGGLSGHALTSRSRLITGSSLSLYNDLHETLCIASDDDMADTALPDAMSETSRDDDVHGEDLCG